MIDDFVIRDCRLRDHPKLSVTLNLRQGNELVCVAATPPRNAHLVGRSVSLNSSLSGHIVRSGEAVHVLDAEERPRILVPQEPTAYSLLAVPVLDQDTVEGVLSLEGYSRRRFNNKDLGRAQILAALVAYHLVHVEGRVREITPVSRSLGQALAHLRKRAGLTQEALADVVGTSGIALSRWEAGAQSPSSGPLHRWCEKLGLISRGGPTIVTSVDVTPQLLAFLREDPHRLSELTPSQFEHLIANLLDQMGFDVSLTGSTSMRDGGIDLIAIPKTRGVASLLLAAQVKHHSSETRTGRAAVDRLLAWKDGAFRIGLLVTNTGFTRDALWVATKDENRAFMRLRDFEDLKRWLSDNFWSEEEWREIPSTIELAPGVTVKIPKVELRTSLQIWPIRVSQRRGTRSGDGDLN